VKVQRGLVANADRRLLRVVLENLVGNAWKFTAKTPEARIEVGASRDGDRLTFFVQDNGAGFDASRATRLFQPFQRLHKQTDFAGTGIGLATVQRVVERHGGRISARSEPGNGATFSWWLGESPRAQPT
jgi:signal transduction histidine kinase